MEHVSPQAADPAVHKLPGCGLAAYTGLLLFICLVGVAGIVGSTWQLMSPGGARGPSQLRPGMHTPVWALAPMREAGLLDVDDVPLAWHDESERLDGTTACALMEDRLVRVADGVGQTLHYNAIAEIAGEGDEQTGVIVTAQGTDPSGAATTISCAFRPTEGGTRMLIQLQAELDRVRG